MNRTKGWLLVAIILWMLLGAAIVSARVGFRGQSPLVGALGMVWMIGIPVLAFGGIWAMERERSGTVWRSTPLGQKRETDTSPGSSSRKPVAYFRVGLVCAVLFAAQGLGLIGWDTLFLTLGRTATGRLVARVPWGRGSMCVYQFTVGESTHELREERCFGRVTVEYLSQNPELARLAGRNSGFEIGAGLFMVAMGVGGVVSAAFELRRRKTEGSIQRSPRLGGLGGGR